MVKTVQFLSAALVLACALPAWQTAPANFVGTVQAVRADSSEIDVQRDGNGTVTVRVGVNTILQRVAPGERDLKQAEPATFAMIAAGDRLLVTTAPDTPEARRVVIMPASEIARRNEADRQDWNRRGLAGAVSLKTGNQITLRIRSLTGESQATIVAGDNTIYRRYAPDSVRFADAQPSTLAEIHPGDQLRARGTKSGDNLRVEAAEIVFGTFQTKAGTVAEVNLEARQVTVKELGTNKPFVVRLTADSQLKSFPDFPGMPGGPGGMGPQAGRTGGPPDLNQIVEHLPSIQLENLKSGATIVVSSTRGAKSGELTAITMLSNAGFLIQMASMQSSRQGRTDGTPNVGGASAMSMGGMGTGLGGLDLSGITQ